MFRVLRWIAKRLTDGEADGYSVVVFETRRLRVKVFRRDGQRFVGIHKSPDRKYWYYSTHNIDTGEVFGGKYPYDWVKTTRS